MGLIDRVKEWLRRRRPVAEPAPADPTAPSPLREFIYLDEVSLRSLLSSQKGEVTEGTSQAIMDGAQVEVTSKVGAPPAVVVAELASRFQTSNSSTLQTSRKASVQSWFREFHAIPNLRLIEPVDGVSAVFDTADLKRVTHPSVLLPASALVRGSLVEFRVRLSADPVFRLGALMSEFSGMADDYPEMFAGHLSPGDFRQTQVVNNVLNRLLAGLIPVRGQVIDYQVVDLDGEEHVVHRNALANLSLATVPLELVGVTEHLAYWKDIRRVLFSEAEFTVLCRVSRTGLHSSWTPVKLTDVFRDVAPDLADQISQAGRTPLVPPQRTVRQADAIERRMADALNLYVSLRHDAVGGRSLSKVKRSRIDMTIGELCGSVGSATEQRDAFRALERLLIELTGAEVDAEGAIALRDKAREASNLPLFPSLARDPVAATAPLRQRDVEDARLLDVEVVAIYW